MSHVVTAVDRLFSYERNTVRQDLRRVVAEIRELKPAAAFAIFVLGWLTGFADSLLVLAIVAALVAGVLLAKSSSVEQVKQAEAVDDDPTAELNAAVERGRQLALANGMPSSIGLADLLTATGLNIRKIEIGAVPAARAKKAVA